MRRIKLTHCARLIKRKSLRDWVRETTNMDCIKERYKFHLYEQKNIYFIRLFISFAWHPDAFVWLKMKQVVCVWTGSSLIRRDTLDEAKPMCIYVYRDVCMHTHTHTLTDVVHTNYTDIEKDKTTIDIKWFLVSFRSRLAYNWENLLLSLISVNLPVNTLRQLKIVFACVLFDNNFSFFFFLCSSIRIIDQINDKRIHNRHVLNWFF